MNEIIFIEKNDPRGFLYTDKTPEEVQKIIDRYIKKIKPKVYKISTKKNDKKNE